MIYGLVGTQPTYATTSTPFVQEWYYMGNGTTQTISGLGFTPSMVIVKAHTTAWWAMFKTSAMPTPNTAYFHAVYDSSTSQLLLHQDWFTVQSLAALNQANVYYTWIAFGPTSCSAEGNYCVGYYIGDGTPTQEIALPFSSDLIRIKRSWVAANRHSLLMPDTTTQFFDAYTQNTNGAYMVDVHNHGFVVGTSNNANLWIYYYVAFKKTPHMIDVGVFTGNGQDNTTITTDISPHMLFIKNAQTAIGSMFSTITSNGDFSHFWSATASITNAIQSLGTNMFQLGSYSAVNASGNTMYWAAFEGTSSTKKTTGNFLLANGSYIWSAVPFSLTGLWFTPDLVMIKHDIQSPAQYAVFRTSMMAGDYSAYLGAALAGFTGAIIGMNADGFGIGTHTSVNKIWIKYYWTAFGNAWTPKKNNGAKDFAVGVYIGNAMDNRNIWSLPFTPDMVAIKSSYTYAWVWRNSKIVWDYSNGFWNVVGAPNNIQRNIPNGFQVGNSANVNANAMIHWRFAFKEGINFVADMYIGNGNIQSIDNVWFSPDVIWIKGASTAQTLSKTSQQTGATIQSFTPVSTVTDAFLGIDPLGFSIGNSSLTNTHSTVYRYVAWRIADTLPPNIMHIQPIESFTSSSTPQYIFSSNEGWTIIFSGICGSYTHTVVSGNNTLILWPLSDGIYSWCTLSVKDQENNISNVLVLPNFVVDTIDPFLAFIDTNTFPRNTSVVAIATGSDDLAGIRSTWVVYSMLPFTVNCLWGTSWIFTFSTEWIYTVYACIQDNAGHITTGQQTYTVDIMAPSIYTGIVTTSINTPTFMFSTNEAGILLWSGVCISSTTTASSGTNSIMLSSLSNGTYNNCYVTLKDLANNTWMRYHIPIFSVHAAVLWWGWWGWWGWGWLEFIETELPAVNINEYHASEWEESDRYSQEIKDAYTFAYSAWITTQPSIQQADMDWKLVRSHMAKMLVNYAKNILQKEILVYTGCVFDDIQTQNNELQSYILQACSLGIMWIDMQSFWPEEFVTRAQFATAFSRLLFGEQYNGYTPYYQWHLDTLKAYNIIKNTDPDLEELRWYIMLMFMRSAQ